MDFIGELPPSKNYNAIFVLVCKLTKFAFFIPCTTNLNEEQAARMFFDKIVTLVGLPKQIISNRDTQWRNNFWKEVCQATGSRRALTTSYHPQVDSQMEILNQTIEVAIRAFINLSQDNWVDLLPYLSLTYNSIPHTATKFTPSFLLYGFQPQALLDFLNNHPSIKRPVDNEFDSLKAQHFTEELARVRLITQDSLKLAQLHYEKSYNQNHIPISFEPGDKVLVNIHSLQLPESKGKGAKFTRHFNRPFEVTEHVGPVAYHIRLPHSYDIHPVLSIAHLEPYKSEEGDKRIGLV